MSLFMFYSQLHISIAFERRSDDRQNTKILKYKGIPKQVSRKDFNHYIKPHLKKSIKGPKPKLSFYKIFNYILYVILYVLHTGIQWNQLRTQRNELHWSNVYSKLYIWQNKVL